MKIRQYVLLLSFSFILAFTSHGQVTPFEKDTDQTATYAETIAFYQGLAKKYPQWFKLTATGDTDAGVPLHVGVLSFDNTFSPELARQKKKLVFFVNNAIHPGEPEGVDATMMLIRDFLIRPEKRGILKNTILVFIPFYNIDGGWNRGRISRINQNGPAAYGFRGNAKNLDLNRDFIKADSKNARTFNQVYARWLPHVFMDNHTSNGADYQYTMTLIATQKDKLNQHLSEYLQTTLMPKLKTEMKFRTWDLSPYVNFEEKVEGGLMAFPDLPRYSSGYAALHNAIGFIPETHMLKPFPMRVRATYDLMESMLKITNADHQKILEAYAKAVKDVEIKTQFDLSWKLDMSRKDSISFKGFESGYKPSEVSGLPRLYYDRSKPYERIIPYYPHYIVTQSITKPKYYVVPKAYEAVIERLQWNGVKMTPLAKDTLLEAEYYTIADYKSSPTPYEGHHLNRDVKLEVKSFKRKYYKGDFLIPTSQPAARYIIETLEPQAPDSFFAWNFFDGILNQKEYFSAYVFEDAAAELLKKNPELKKKLEEKRAAEPTFAASASAQLDFVYRNSEYYEPSHKLYPVARIMK